MREVAEYIGRKFRYGSDIQRSLENEIKTRVPSPTSPTGTGDDVELSSNQNFAWEKMMTEYVKQEKKLDDNCQKSYALIFGHCIDNIHSKLEAR